MEAHEPATSAVADAVREARASIARTPKRQRVQLQRRCEVVERYYLRGESRESICRQLRISKSTFYLDRSVLLARIPKPGRLNGATVESPLTVRFQEAELLIQVDAHDLAAKRLREIATHASDENDRIAALGRLAQVECDANRFEAAREALASARKWARVAEPKLQHRAHGAILAAESCCSFWERDARTLARCAEELDRLATQQCLDPQLWSLAVTAWFRTGYYHYLRREIGAADTACGRSEAALTRAGNTRLNERATALALRAEIDRYDPTRAHRAGDEDADAYRLAVEHGMVVSASAALYNTLLPLLLSDDALEDENRWIVREVARTACELATPYHGTMIVAVALAVLEHYDDANALLARCDYHQGTFAWSPVHRMIQARILFKARRFQEAERAARAALQQCDPSGLGGEGKALRIRAEALEALGERRSAAAVIDDALEALRESAPVYHLLAAYRCAARVAPRRAYQAEIESLAHALHKRSALARWSDVLVQKSRVAVTRSLTRRQRHIALLVADGRTNPAIARELGVSTKTVANHLAAIFERLGLRARWQLTRELLQPMLEPRSNGTRA